RCQLSVVTETRNSPQFSQLRYSAFSRHGQRTTDNGLQSAKNRYRITSTSATPSATVKAYFGLFVLLTSGIKSDAATYNVTPAESARPYCAQLCASPIANTPTTREIPR